jgi:probable rRNA maturation factor
MTAITISNEDRRSCDTAALVDLLAHHMPKTGVDPNCPVHLLFVDADRMTELHVEWMGEPGPTDVLSFPMDEVRGAPETEPASFGTLGDIVICLEVAEQQAMAQGRSLDEEVQFLVTHGYLHLIGFDHADDTERAEMFELQDDLLARWRAGRSSS